MAADSLKVLALCGSQRLGSYNRKLLDVSTDELISLGVVVNNLSMPTEALPVFFNGISPQSQATREAVTDLRSQIASSDGLIICSPQVNGSIPPYLKNIIDWTAPSLQSDGVNVFKDKVVCLLGAARGSSTCLGGLAHLSTVFGFLGAIVVPQFYGVSHAEKAITDAGAIVDVKIAANLKNYLKTFNSLLQKF